MHPGTPFLRVFAVQRYPCNVRDKKTKGQVAAQYVVARIIPALPTTSILHAYPVDTQAHWILRLELLTESCGGLPA